MLSLPLQEIISLNSFDSLNSLQEEAIAKGLYEENLVVSAPTASGKTFIAELSALHTILKENKKVIYTCPLKALASEHFNEFKKKYASKYSLKVALSTGDLDSTSGYLKKYDVIFTTYEKLYSLIKHRTEWLSRVGLLVIDELHVLDSDRGPTIELIVMSLRSVSKPRILGLSATIPNCLELSSWLEAKLVESVERPVPLKKGVLLGFEVDYGSEKEFLPPEESSLKAIALDVLDKGKQGLVFCNTRKNSEVTARALSVLTETRLSLEDTSVLSKTALACLNALEQPTTQCKVLASLIEKGIAFHHAGLLQKQRTAIEEAFREGRIKFLCSTPTLAAGVNTPAHTVVMNSVYRYSLEGMRLIPVRDYLQACGRAGRPRYDKEGRAVIIARSDVDKELFFERFVLGEAEEVYSQLGIEPVLRHAILSSITIGFAFDLDSLERFLSGSFYAFQYKSLESLNQKVMKMLKELEEMGFISCKAKGFTATPLGQRVSELYLDPLSAFKIVQGLKKSLPDYSELYYLYLLADTYEMAPYVNVSRQEEQEYFVALNEKVGSLPLKLEELFTDYSCVRKYATARLFLDWANELNEEEISKRYKVLPGVLQGKRERLDWLIYSAQELSRLLRNETHSSNLGMLRVRVKHGVRKELLPLVQLKGIGRVRARSLYRKGFDSLAKIRSASLKELALVLGEKTAEKVLAQLK